MINNTPSPLAPYLLKEIAAALFPHPDPTTHAVPPASEDRGANDNRSRLRNVINDLYLNEDKATLDKDLNYYVFEHYPYVDLRQPDTNELEFEEVDVFDIIKSHSSLNSGGSRLSLYAQYATHFDGYIEIQKGSNTEDVVDLETRNLLFRYVDEKKKQDIGILVSLSDLSSNYFRVKRDGLDIYGTLQIALIDNFTDKRANLINSCRKTPAFRRGM